MKKWIALLAAMVMALSLCACAKSKGEPPTVTPTVAPTEQVPTDPPQEPEPEKEPVFYLLREISATLLNEIDYVDMSIRLQYDADYRLIGTGHYEGDQLITSIDYRPNTLDILRQEGLSQDGNPMETFTYEYIEAGKVLTIRGVDPAGEEVYSQVYTYDEDGLPSSVETFYDGQLSYWESYHYDENGYRDSFTSGDGSGNCYQDLRYQNVVEDGVLKAIITLKNGEYWHTVAYNDQGKPITEVQYDDNQQKTGTIQYTYTETGKPLMQTHYNGEEQETYRVEYEYDVQDQLIRICRLRWGNLEQKAEYTYHEGRLLGYKSYTHDQLDGEYTYLYEAVSIPVEQESVLSDIYAKLMQN